MPMYNLMEYSNNYSDTSGSLWQFKRDEIENNANNLTFPNCSSFEYISKFVNNTDNTGNDAIANAAKAAFKITSGKLYAPIVTLLTADNAKLSKLLSKEFKRLVYWNKNFNDQSINDLIKQYNEVRKLSIGQGDDYTIGCLLDYAYFKDNYRLIFVDLSKQKALDVDLKSTRQIYFTGKTKSTFANTRVIIYCIVEQSNETTLRFSRGRTKVL